MERGEASLLNRLFRRLEIRDRLSDEEKAALEAASGGVRVFSAGSDIVKDGSRPTSSTLLIEGFATRYNVTTEGKRQITATHVPGDFVDLHSFPLQKMDHSVGALTDCTVVMFPHAELSRITESHPHLTRMLWLLTLMDAAIHRSWLVSMGGTSALSHTAHFICETYTRLEAVGLSAEHAMSLPFKQIDLADILGISSVHVNRVVQDLRRDGLITWEGREVRVLDWDRLAQLGQFDPAYLFMERLPR